MKQIYFIFILFFIIVNHLLAFPQSNKVQDAQAFEKVHLDGQVRPLGNLSPIEDALVIDLNNKLNFTRTNKKGLFTITVAKDSKGILIRAENFQDLEVLMEGGVLILRSPFLLEPSTEYGGTGIIRARRKDEISQNTFQQDELSHVAGTGGDAVRALQTLPSVLPANVGSADVVVRGGSPGDNSYFYDDLLLPFIFHFGGAETIIPTRMIESMDFYPGAFSSYYTDTIGGVIQLKSFGSVPKRTSGEIELGLIQSGIYMEGNAFGSSEAQPSVKAENEQNQVTDKTPEKTTEKANDAIGYRAGFRRTYLELYKPLIAKLANNSNFVTIPQATDYQFILNGNHSSGTWQVYLLGAIDSASLSAPIGNSTTASGQNSFSFYNGMETSGLRYNLNLGNGLGFRFTFQQRYLTLQQEVFGNSIDITSHLFSLGFIVDKKINEEVSYSVGVRPKYQHVEVGIDAIQLPGGGFTDNFDPELAPVQKEIIYLDSFYGDMFLDIIYSPFNKFIVNPGINMLVGSQKNEFGVDPRIGVRYEFAEGQTIKAGGGYYSQFPPPQYVSPKYGNPNLSLEKSIQYVLGFESKFLEDYSSDIQIWYKSSNNLVGPAVVNPADKYENSIEMRAKGVEFFLKKKASGIWYGWMSYGISQSERRDPGSGIWRRSDYDRTHSVNIVYGQKITSRWNAGTRIQFMTGTPFSTVAGGVYDQNTGKYSPMSDGKIYLISKNDDRVPYFFEVDFRTEYDFLFKDWTLTSYLDILNILNRSNVTDSSYNKDYSKRVDITGLPIIPSVGVIAKF